MDMPGLYISKTLEPLVDVNKKKKQVSNFSVFPKKRKWVPIFLKLV